MSYKFKVKDTVLIKKIIPLEEIPIESDVVFETVGKIYQIKSIIKQFHYPFELSNNRYYHSKELKLIKSYKKPKWKTIKWY